MHAAIVAGVHGAVAGAVVLRVKDDDVVIGVVVLRVGLVKPPVRGLTPVAATVVGSEQVDAPGPDDFRIGGVDGQGVVVPALVQAEAIAEAARRE
jgi:hypothetical protein